MQQLPLRFITLLGVTLSSVLLLIIAEEGRGESTSLSKARFLILNATVIDGTGAPRRSASVRVQEGRIVDVGTLTPSAEEKVMDARGLVLAPGFIDTHSHHDADIQHDRSVRAAVSQGITTIIVGQDGSSHFPLAEYFARLEEEPVAVNLASYAGHNSLRDSILQKDFRRPATPAERGRMAALLRQELQNGALGLSTGLEYDPGIFSDAEEVLFLARVAAEVGGRYISHLRSEDRNFWDALEEIIQIGAEAKLPVQVSHMKLAMVGLWKQSPLVIRRLEDARRSGVEISADVYPYEYWQSTMTVLFPDRDFTNRSTATFALTELTTPEGMLIASFEPDSTYVGKTLAEIAGIRYSDPVSTYMELIQESQALSEKTGRGTESIIATSMDSSDVANLIAWEHTNICSDGYSGGHPRGFGAFPRVLSRYVRQQGRLTFEEALRKMTSLAAEHMGISDRGVIRPGAWADLVLIDTARIADMATTKEPRRAAVGIERVWVNGVEVYDGRNGTGLYPGHVIRRHRK